MMRWIYRIGIVVCLTSVLPLVDDSLGRHLCAQSSSNTYQVPIQKKYSDVVQQYGLKDPLKWLEATRAVTELKANSTKKYREGKSKANMKDRRSAIDGKYTNNSRYRREGQRLLAESKSLGSKAAKIEEAILEVKKAYAAMPKYKALTGIRDWKSKDGLNIITGRILWLKGDSVLFHRDDGVVFGTSVLFFSDEDFAFLKLEEFKNEKRVTITKSDFEQAQNTNRSIGMNQSREWSFNELTLPMRGQLIKDGNGKVLIAADDGHHYRFAFAELSEVSRKGVEEYRSRLERAQREKAELELAAQQQQQAALERAQQEVGLNDQESPQGDSNRSTVKNDTTTELPSIKQSIEQLISDLSDTLEQNEITALGVTRFYINGSSLDDQSSPYLNRMLGILLNQGRFDVFDRSTLSVVLEEDKLQYIVSGESETSLSAGEAIVIGDLIFTENSSEALVAIRAVETSSSKLFFARTARARISSDEMKDLNLVYRDITKNTLPHIEAESSKQLSSSFARAKGRATGFSLVFDTPQTESLPLWGRIGYFETIERAASQEMILYDRDLILSLFEEAALNSNDDQTLSFGDALISIKLDGVATDQAKASIKIYNRSNSALLGISELRFTGDSDEQVAKPWDDSFAATLQHMRKRTELDANDLKFESTFKLDSYNAKSEALAIMQVVKNNSNKGLWCTQITAPGKEDVIMYRQNLPGASKFNVALTRASLVRKLGDVSRRLVVKEDVAEDEIRKKLIFMIILGIYDFHEGLYSGLWEDVSCRMRSELTTSREGVAQRRFREKLWPFVENWAENNELPYQGNYTDKDISFNYSIDFRFKGIYPEWVTLQIDLTPMKDRLYKVIKDENKNN